MAGNFWTKEEIEFLKENYSQHGATYCSGILNRTRSSTTQKANRLGLKSGLSLRNNIWLEEEDLILLTYYADNGVNGCTKFLPKRTKGSISCRAKVLGISTDFRKATWTHSKYEDTLFSKEIDFFPIENYIGFDTKIKHECLNGHVWSVMPSSILNGTGCPLCAKYGFNPSKPAILYYIKVETDLERYYKIGITNRSVKKRFLLDTDKTITILLEEYFDIGQDAKNKEKQILSKYKKFRVSIGSFMRSGGNTEMFEIDILGLDI